MKNGTDIPRNAISGRETRHAAQIYRNIRGTTNKKPFSSTTTAFRHTRPSSLHLSAAHDHSQDRSAIPYPPLSRKDKLHPRRNDSRWQTAQIFQPQYFEYKNNRIDEKIKEGRDQIAAFPKSSGQFPELSSEISHPEHILQ
ncbi:MAG: hypothetical protein ACLTZY_09720 [Alistipes indistinctus]